MAGSKFAQELMRAVRNIPWGKVASYGQVAAYLNVPRAARQVGWTLRRLEGVEMPWWRVVNNSGRVSIKGNVFNTPELQRRRLRGEGVVVAKDFSFDIEKYRFNPDEALMKKWGLRGEYLKMVHDKFRTGY